VSSILQRVEKSLAEYLDGQVAGLSFYPGDSSTYLKLPYGAVYAPGYRPLDVPTDEVDVMDVFVVVATDIDSSPSDRALNWVGDVRRALNLITYQSWKDTANSLALYGLYIRSVDRANKRQSRGTIFRLRVHCSPLESSDDPDCKYWLQDAEGYYLYTGDGTPILTG
jgi:hypothetical protein